MARGKKRELPEINSGSMADIAFLLLIFFLVTTTMDQEQGIRRELPRKTENQQPVDVARRNVLLVFINRNDQLLVNGEYGDIRILKDRVVEFVLNPTNDPNLSAKKEEPESFEGLFTYRKSKGVVVIQNDRLTSYKMYVKTQDVLTMAFNQMRNDLAREKFGETYDEMKMRSTKGATDEIKEEAAKRARAVEKAIPMAISEASPNK